MTNRADETPKTHFRVIDRCFKTNGEWYFATREGVNVGPYATREAADRAVARLLKMLDGVEEPLVVNKIIREFMYLKGTRVRMP